MINNAKLSFNEKGFICINKEITTPIHKDSISTIYTRPGYLLITQQGCELVISDDEIKLSVVTSSILHRFIGLAEIKSGLQTVSHDFEKNKYIDITTATPVIKRQIISDGMSELAYNSSKNAIGKVFNMSSAADLSLTMKALQKNDHYTICDHEEFDGVLEEYIQLLRYLYF